MIKWKSEENLHCFDDFVDGAFGEDLFDLLVDFVQEKATEGSLRAPLAEEKVRQEIDGQNGAVVHTVRAAQSPQLFQLVHQRLFPTKRTRNHIH